MIFRDFFVKKKVVTVSVTVTRGCSEGVCVTVTGRVTGLLKTKKRNHSTRLPKHAQQQNTPNQRRDQTPLQTPLEARPATSQNTPPLTRVFHRVIHRLWKTFSAGLRRGRIHPSRPIVPVRFMVCKFLSLVVAHVVSFLSFRSVCKFLSPRSHSCRGHRPPRGRGRGRCRCCSCPVPAPPYTRFPRNVPCLPFFAT